MKTIYKIHNYMIFIHEGSTNCISKNLICSKGENNQSKNNSILINLTRVKMVKDQVNINMALL